jgi:hypothetical protein
MSNFRHYRFALGARIVVEWLNPFILFARAECTESVCPSHAAKPDVSLNSIQINCCSPRRKC